MTTPTKRRSTAEIIAVQQRSENLTELLIGNVPVDAGTGFGDSVKIVLVLKDGRMQRPLAAAPRSAIVHFAAILIEDTVAIDRLHLHDIPRYPPIRLSDRVLISTQGLDHTFSIVGIQGNGGVAMAAITAPRTGKYPGNNRHTLHHEKNRRTAKINNQVGSEENTLLQPDFH